MKVLDVSGLAATLKALDCEGCHLLEVLCARGCSKLTMLDCDGCLQLRELSCKGCESLKTVEALVAHPQRLCIHQKGFCEGTDACKEEAGMSYICMKDTD